MLLTRGAELPPKIRYAFAIRRFLRSDGNLNENGRRPFGDHEPTGCNTENLGNTGCPDERYQYEEQNHIMAVHNKRPVTRHLFGGGMRFSPRCSVPIDWYREKIVPKYRRGQEVTDEQIVQWDKDDVESTIRAIIGGTDVRGFRLYKLGIHGPYCGWANLLGYGLIQQIWLLLDGANHLEQMAAENDWGQFEIYCTYHEHYQPGEEAEAHHKTYHIKRSHHLFSKFTLGQIMGMTDEEYLRREAMPFLADDDPELYAELMAD